MKTDVAERKSPPNGFRAGTDEEEKFESVEFSIQGLQCLHQFRIWNTVPGSMCVLVKENSEILGALKVGDVLPLKYYTGNSGRPTLYLDTEIRHITKEEEGRFKGHYLIGLSILEGGGERRFH
ncbi:MAG: hypothetical protein JRH13_08430 [Deltaproteobacteria bacterium]|nr:hypothetical protein [Deltaproteobacteria bacterium]MBW2016968.1 hypothetical protein [Deltaproteobacteria bacterium]MBW2129376.1 hypothetical protein [Deltaproteobacteria bacterium]MBW2303718.1 hypothetical protein [Deltaproteobacteria bacterium]